MTLLKGESTFSVTRLASSMILNLCFGEASLVFDLALSSVDGASPVSDEALSSPDEASSVSDKALSSPDEASPVSDKEPSSFEEASSISDEALSEPDELAPEKGKIYRMLRLRSRMKQPWLQRKRFWLYLSVRIFRYPSNSPFRIFGFAVAECRDIFIVRSG